MLVSSEEVEMAVDCNGFISFSFEIDPVHFNSTPGARHSQGCGHLFVYCSGIQCLKSAIHPSQDKICRADPAPKSA